MDGGQLKSNRPQRREELRDEAGSGLIEIALVLPVFFLLFFGFINFALILFQTCNLTYASRAAVRYACVHSGTSYVPATMTDINNIVNPFIYNFPQNTITTTLSYNPSNTVGATATVKIKLVYNVTVPGWSKSGLTLSTQASGAITQ